MLERFALCGSDKYLGRYPFRDSGVVGPNPKWYLRIDPHVAVAGDWMSRVDDSQVDVSTQLWSPARCLVPCTDFPTSVEF